MEILDLVAYSYETGKRVLEKKSLETLKIHGRFLTLPASAQYTAKQLGRLKNKEVIV